ncbi:MAG TPA: carboxymuconolactone decarboxylase family protein [Rhodanobacteraceae bacterium]|nr:carboxymuconolactone decarboxylase family protein [Rhodanobacteraceae bacterium]
MSLSEIKSAIPDYAKDLRLNLDSVLSENGAPGLSGKQIGLVALASAIASRYEPLVTAIAGDAATRASAQELNGARTAAAIMAMNNVYYRFTHLVGEPEYQTLRAGLRMNAMANPGCDKLDFELCSLAASAINGCGMCMGSHEKTLRKHGLPAQAVHSAVRIAAVVHAVAVTLEQAGAGEANQAALAA